MFVEGKGERVTRWEGEITSFSSCCLEEVRREERGERREERGEERRRERGKRKEKGERRKERG